MNVAQRICLPVSFSLWNVSMTLAILSFFCLSHTTLTRKHIHTNSLRLYVMYLVEDIQCCAFSRYIILTYTVCQCHSYRMFLVDCRLTKTHICQKSYVKWTIFSFTFYTMFILNYLFFAHSFHTFSFAHKIICSIPILFRVIYCDR